MIKPYYEEPSGIIYNADCLDVIPQLTDKIDLILTDPPYGIDYSNENSGRLSPNNFNKIQNDNIEMDFSFLFNRPELLIMFGANNYYKQLPHKGIWLCWDKRCVETADKLLGYPFELAWCSKKSGYGKIYRVQHGGVRNANAIKGASQKRVHPTEKPVELMRKIILDFTDKGDIVLDCFAGSGTTLRACKDLGRKFIGIEISKEYCDIAVKRLEQEVLF